MATTPPGLPSSPLIQGERRLKVDTASIPRNTDQSNLAAGLLRTLRILANQEPPSSLERRLAEIERRLESIELGLIGAR